MKTKAVILRLLLAVFRKLNKKVVVIRNHIFVQGDPLDRIDYIRIHESLLRLSGIEFRKEQVYIHINSGGGNICKELINLLDKIAKLKNVTATTFGCASVAAYIFLSFVNRKIPKKASVVLHGAIISYPLGQMEWVDDSYSLPSEWSKNLKEYQERLKKVLGDRTEMGPCLINHIFSDEVRLSGLALKKFRAVESYL